ncbi:hypothetical protein LEMLEM_LOCUS18948 [Lemmus lemmus]
MSRAASHTSRKRLWIYYSFSLPSSDLPCHRLNAVLFSLTNKSNT